jgi:hypothetical protein
MTVFLRGQDLWRPLAAKCLLKWSSFQAIQNATLAKIPGNPVLSSVRATSVNGLPQQKLQLGAVPRGQVQFCAWFLFHAVTFPKIPCYRHSVQTRQPLSRTKIARPPDARPSLASAGASPGLASGSPSLSHATVASMTRPAILALNAWSRAIAGSEHDNLKFGAVWCSLVPFGALGPANFRGLPLPTTSDG